MELNIKLTVDEINVVMAALAKRPFEEVHTLISKIKVSGEAEIAAQNQVATENATKTDGPYTGEKVLFVQPKYKSIKDISNAK